MTLQDEVVKVLRSDGCLTEYDISERLFSHDMAKAVIDGEDRMIPPKWINDICEDCSKIDDSGAVNCLRKEYE
jgi:hypothetical protein